MALVVICNPDSARTESLVRSLLETGVAAPTLVPYSDILDGKVRLADVIQPGAIVRIESPGKDFRVERKILLLGAPMAEERDGNALSERFLQSAHPRVGEILAPRQWYYGWCELLHRMAAELEDCREHFLMNSLEDIEVMYDKPTCQNKLQAASIAVPRVLGTIRSYDELRHAVQESGCQRLFLKIANGSSASGVVAYQTNNRGQQRAVTTTEMEWVNGFPEPSLFNNRKLRTYDRESDIVALINALGRHYLHVEQWIPKACIGNRAFDFRVVVINGRAMHTLARISSSPITNLHLLNDRVGMEELRTALPGLDSSALNDICTETMRRAFPNSMYAGIDVLVSRNLKDFAVAEVNAFGDHLNNCLFEGLTTYQAEMSAIQSLCSIGSRSSCYV
jgi:hypothetical protein